MSDAETDSEELDGLAEEYAGRLRRGEQPSVSEYAARAPGLADEIRALFPSIAMIEQLKRRKQDEARAATVPERLGDYRIVREIGRGGMGIVFEAEQTSLGRRVALKILPRHSLLDPRRLARFQHEARAAARLHHTNIVPVFGVGEHEGLPYLVMQLIDGHGLDAILHHWKQRATAFHGPGSPGVLAGDLEPPPPAPPKADDAPPRDWKFIARAGLQAADGLAFAHSQGVLHRDIKPANLLIDRQGVVWVTDFGLAKLIDLEGLTETGDLLGTLQYMAPERFHGPGDARSDVYSLGLTLYELLTLEAAFPDSTPSALVRRDRQAPPRPPRKIDPAIPRDLETVVLKAIAHEPGHRYPTAAALADDLRRFLDDRPVRARRISPPERLWRWGRRHRTVAALSALSLSALLLAAVVGWVGYATTRRALDRESARSQDAERARKQAVEAQRRADENVALSLRAFEDLFNTIAPKDWAPPPPPRPPGPGAGPPRRGSPQRREGPPPRPVMASLDPARHPAGFDLDPPPPRDDDFGPPPRGGPHRPPPRDDDFGPPPRPEAPPPPGPEGPGRARDERTDEEAALLQTILTFYDRFAARNATNVYLQREAAYAYRRVGDLHRRLDREEQADASYRRAAELFEALVAGGPHGEEDQPDLIESYLRIEPPSDDPAGLARAERGLRRALALAEERARRTPPLPGSAALRARCLLALGDLLAQSGRDRDAEAHLRLALTLQAAVFAKADARTEDRLTLTDARLALGDLLVRQSRRDEARALLVECRDELDWSHDLSIGPEAGPTGREAARWLVPRLEDLADAFRALGEPKLAAECDDQADSLRPRGHGPPPPR